MKKICWLLSLLLHAALLCLILPWQFPAPLIRGEKAPAYAAESIVEISIASSLAGSRQGMIKNSPAATSVKPTSVMKANRSAYGPARFRLKSLPGFSLPTAKSSSFSLAGGKLEAGEYHLRLFPRTAAKSTAELDLKKYLYGGLPPIPFPPYATNSGEILKPAFGEKSKGISLTAWANAVVRKIQNNWIIPQAARFGAQGMVGITLTIERNGRIAAWQMDKSSQDKMLDQAAEQSLLASSPLPALPASFPADDISLYFVFYYNE
jgi:TonB family protein